MGSIPWASEHLGLALSVSCITSSGSLHLLLLLFYHLGTPSTRRPFPGEGRRPGLPLAGGDRVLGILARSALGRLGCPRTPPLHWGLELWLGGGTVWRENRPGLPKGLASAGPVGRGCLPGVSSRDHFPLRCGEQGPHAPTLAVQVTSQVDGSHPAGFTGEDVESKKDRKNPRSPSPATSFDRWGN